VQEKKSNNINRERGFLATEKKTITGKATNRGGKWEDTADFRDNGKIKKGSGKTRKGRNKKKKNSDPKEKKKI